MNKRGIEMTWSWLAGFIFIIILILVLLFIMGIGREKMELLADKIFDIWRFGG